MIGSREGAAEMSKGLAQLSVDLGSFFNVADVDALNALRSGIVGELEPLKRFGIVMTEAALKQFALDQGIRKQIKSMSIAEKTTLRYKFIMARTADAQGDAEKTADTFANASKGLQSALKDMATTIGKKLLPAAEGIVVTLRDWVRALEPLLVDSEALEVILAVLGTAMLGLAVVGAAKLIIALGSVTTAVSTMGAAALIANLKLLLIGVAFFVLLAIILFVGNEIYRWATGQENLFDLLSTHFNKMLLDFIDEPIDPEDHWMTKAIKYALKALDWLEVKAAEVVFEMTQKWDKAWKKAGRDFKAQMETIKSAFMEVSKFMGGTLETLGLLPGAGAIGALEKVYRVGKKQAKIAELGGGIGVGTMLAPPISGPTSMSQANRIEINNNITQQPGESGEQLANRIIESAERITAAAAALTPAVATQGG
jgi:hypothetical protein